MKSPKLALRVAATAAVAVAVLSALACQYKRAAMMDRATGLAEPMAYLSGSRGIRGGGGGGDRLSEVAFSGMASQMIGLPQLAAPANRKIVRNGSLEMVVADVAQASGKIRGIVDGLGGYVEKSSQMNVGSRSATLTVRVPAASLDQAMSQIERVALNVDQESVEARDVTREYIDLDARLRNAQAEEARYLEILKRATTIKDTLDGAEKLSNVRGRIEQLQGEMRYLNTQIDMSSLLISLQTEADATVLGTRWRPLRQAKIALREMISGLADWADSVIAFFINLPLILVWVVSVLALVVVAVRILRFCWRKLGPKKTWTLPWRRSRGETGTTS